MFKCAICGREFDDKELNEIKLLNKQANNMEIHQVCSTCFTNKEDMIGYISDKKNISFSSARQIYDYFSFLGRDLFRAFENVYGYASQEFEIETCGQHIRQRGYAAHRYR